MKYIYILLFIVAMPLSAISQDYDENYIKDDFYYPSSVDSGNKYNRSPFKKSRTPFFNENNFNFRLTTGTSYSNFYGDNLFSSYIMPEVRYKLNNKFTISGGIIASLDYFPNFNISGQEGSTMLNDNKAYNYYIFAKGEYTVSENFRIRGTTMFNPGNSMFNNRSSYNSIGFDVRIAEKTVISADVSVYRHNLNYPSFNDPFGGYFNGFYTHPLGGNVFSIEHFSQW